MNDEIKEILDWLKDEDIYIEDYGYQYKRISLKETKQLLDYITNLQELCDMYEEEHNTKFTEWVFDKRENEKLKQVNKILEENWEHYMMKCGKAIEIYKNRNNCKYKKERFMENKTTADLMFEILQDGNEE